MITIRKAILSGTALEQIRDRASGLASVPLRDLAVSVVTYQDGREELEVLHTGPPHRDENTIDRRRFSRQPGRSAECGEPDPRHPPERLHRLTAPDYSSAKARFRLNLK